MDDDERKRTLFVGNLSGTVSRKELSKLFSTYGRVESVRLRSAIPNKEHIPKKAAVIKQQLFSEKDTLNAYVKFETEDAVKASLQLNGQLIGGRHVQVDSCASGKRYDSKRTVFLGNLPFGTYEDQLYEHFSDCGEIDKIRLVRNRVTGVGKGFGFVVFKDPAAVSFALKLNGAKFGTREMRITRVVKKHKLPSKNETVSGGRGGKSPGNVKVKKAKPEQATKQASKQSGAAIQNPKKKEKKILSKKVRKIVKKRHKEKKGKKSFMSS